jgi:hypothetical protein
MILTVALGECRKPLLELRKRAFGRADGSPARQPPQRQS